MSQDLSKLLKSDMVAWFVRTLMLVLIGSLWLYADKHNDGRYVSQENYKKEVEAQKQDMVKLSSLIVDFQKRHEDDVRSFHKQHEDDTRLLAEIGNDIKWLKENMKR